MTVENDAGESVQHIPVMADEVVGQRHLLAVQEDLTGPSVLGERLSHDAQAGEKRHDPYQGATRHAPQRKENEMIAWRSLEGADIVNAGSVHFKPAGVGMTELDVVFQYSPPAGAEKVMVGVWFLVR